MNAISPMSSFDEYDVKSYTDEQLFDILNLNNPSDRELEAQILTMIRKYRNIGNQSGFKLAKFFTDIYDYFFEEEEAEAEAEDEKEGFITLPEKFKDGNIQIAAANGSSSEGYNLLTGSKFSDVSGTIGSANVGSTVKDTGSGGGVQLTKPLDYSKDNLNPLLKQTIKRIISIDSQYRDNKDMTPTTNFTFNLSEPLKDVVSLSLYSIQIPYTWYTVNSDFGGNFFYLKGNSPGIDNGDHDYMVSIPSGNYIASDLVDAVNVGFQSLAGLHPDVSFGNTMAVYNNGIKSTSSGTSKARIQVDITKVFNEQSYQLTFPNWSSPYSFTDSFGTLQTSRFATIAGYLGFNSPIQSCSAIYSSFFPYYSTSNYSTNVSLRECDVANNGTFTVVPYVGPSYLTATTIYTPISITIPNGKYSQSALVQQLDLSLSVNSKLDSNYSHCRWNDLSGNDAYGFPIFKQGSSYIQINCALNKLNAPIVENLKLAAVFPGSANSIFVDTSLNNFNSYFKLAYNPDSVDLCGNVICEMNTLVSDSGILQTNYDVSGTTQIRFVCTANGYIDTLNDYEINIPQSSTGGYALLDYVTSIQTAIKSYVNTSQKSIQNTSFEYAATGYFYLSTYIRTSFNNTQYKIKGNGIFQQVLGIPNTYTLLSNKNVFNNSSYNRLTTVFGVADTIVISPVDGNGNHTTFDISFNDGVTYRNYNDVANHIETAITKFTDAFGRKPFSNSTVVYSPNTTGITLTMNVNLNLNQSDYKLVFYSDPSGTGMNSTERNINTWSQNLSFDISYNLGSASAYVDVSGTFTTVKNRTPKSENKITIVTGSNDTMYLTPYSTINGLQTISPANQYRIPIVVPPKDYSIVELTDVINSILIANPLTKGSSLSLMPINGQTFVIFRFNINKVFTTADYRVVFYDPTSFAKCFSGKSKKGTKSAQNATWDSTLGWLLGFRNSIEYNLREYVGIIADANTSDYLGFYLKTSPNACAIVGDTSVSTNLYNYFLIMLDDYVQNHLNDGLVTITSQETNLAHEPAIYICDPTTGERTAVPANYKDPGVNYTQQQLYSFNQKVQSDAAKVKSYSAGPFVRDIFGIVPVKTAGLSIGSSYVEFGGTLQNQQRLYFGPVNIHRMTIQLLNDRGNLVDLNNANWSFSLICEQLYKNGY